MSRLSAFAEPAARARDLGTVPRVPPSLPVAGRPPERGAMTVRYELQIEAPVEKVFDFFKDPANWPKAAPDERVGQTLVHVTQEGLGTFYVWSARMAGLRLEGFGVFTEFVQNERIVDTQSWAFEGSWTYTFEREGSGTRLTLERHPRSFWRLPLFDRLWYRLEGPMWERSNARFEAVIEASAAPATGAG